MTLAAGTRVGHYEILASVGEGGMGQVYRAWNTHLRTEVAVKVLPDHLARDANALARFEREALALAKLKHPNILVVHDFVQEAEVPFLVTELLEGETLRARLVGAPMPWRAALEIGVGIAEGLASAHEHGIIHRDLKPENVFLTPDGRVKILDFGLARSQEPGPLRSLEETVRPPMSTKSGYVAGTPAYMSPEQARGMKIDGRTDIFALGCILYEMITGRRAFEGESVPEVFAAIARDEPADPGDLVPGLPDAVRRLVLRCLAKHPQSRFQSARDLASAMKEAAREAAPVLPPRRRAFPRAAAIAGSLPVVVVLAYFLWKILHPPGPIDSLAVLPFANATRDPGLEYLSEGITESLINRFSRLPQLRVPARSTVFAHGMEPDPQKAGRRLGVRAVLTGRLVRLGSDLLVQTDLVDVKNGSQIWGDQFPAELSNPLAVQEAIAQKISQSARLKLTGEDERRLAKRDTESGEAYLAYLKGRYHWNRRTEEGVSKAIQFFEEAIRQDPSYARAFAGIADSYAVLAFYGWRPAREVLPKARENAVRALRIDDTIAEAHATVADTDYLFDGNWENAEKGFQRAISLNPSYPTAHQWYANYLTVSGRSREAIAEISKARDLDPLDLVISTDVGLTYYYAADYARALEQYRKTLEIEPNFILTHIYLGLARLQRGELERAIEEARKACDLAPGEPDALALLGHAYGRAGRRRDAEATLQRLKALARERYVSAFPIAFVYVGLGEKDRAFEWLERAYEERTGRLVYLGIEPAFDSLRSDPRFADLLRRMRVPAARSVARTAALG